MPISYKHKFKFIHIPKTGGTSIEYMFGLRNERSLFISGKRTIEIDGVMFTPQHLPHSEIIKRRPESKDWFSFTIVRNPYTRLVSEYISSHRAHTGRNFEKFDESHFNKWIDNTLLQFNDDHKMKQVFFIDEPVNLIIKFENLQDGIEKLNDELGTDNKLIWKNRSKFNKQKIVDNLSDQTRDRIYDIFESDFKQNNYSKLGDGKTE